MKQYPKSLGKLINELSKLPGIGDKTAQRLAFHVLSLSEKEAEALADAVVEAKHTLKYCSCCGNFTDKDPCDICSDDDRRKDVICVVESPKDVIAIERIGEFEGKYHVLHGVISAMEGIALFPIVMLQSYFGISVQSAIIYAAIVLILVKLLTIYKCFVIFFRQNGAILQIILYFCALEIIPMLALAGFLVMIVDYLKINF